MARQYRSTVEAKTLSSGINSSVTSMTLNSVTTLPSSYPYTLVIDPDTATEEIVTVTALASGTTLTIVRAQDGTSAQAHDAAAVVKHMITARDLQEPHDHIDATAAHGATGAVVGTTNTQSLTNKTVNLSSNTLTGTTAQFNTALSDGNFATQAGTETLTNKTLTSPKINEDVSVTATATELNVLDGITASTAELNILDGVTSTAAELNILDGVTTTTAELNILSGVTASTAELNILDGVTATTAELNILDGVTATASELNKLDGATVTTAELNLLDGLLSNIAWDSDPGTSVSGFAGTGSEFDAKRSMGVVTVHLYMIKTGSTITTGADGNIANTTVYTLDSEFRPTYGFATVFDINGESGGAALINVNGTVEIRSFFDEDSEIASGDSVRISATYVK